MVKESCFKRLSVCCGKFNPTREINGLPKTQNVANILSCTKVLHPTTTLEFSKLEKKLLRGLRIFNTIDGKINHV